MTVLGPPATLSRRGETVLMRWFDAADCVPLVEQHRTQTSALVPSMISMLLAQPPEQRRLGSVGKPVPGVCVRIAAPDGSDLAPGEDGEICVRGPVVRRGYWSPEAPAEALRGGELRTGDVGHLDDDGLLHVVDRIEDVIFRNGRTAYPRDVEDVLLANPEITAAAVVGRPDPRTGEEVVAFVAVTPGSSLTPDRVVADAKEHLSAAEYPREVRVVDTVPLTSVLETDRKALRRLLTAADRP